MWRCTGAHFGGLGPRNGPDFRPLSEWAIESLANYRTREVVDKDADRSVKLLCLEYNVEGHTFDIRDAAKVSGLAAEAAIFRRSPRPNQKLHDECGLYGRATLRVKDRIVRIMAVQIPILFANRFHV